MLPLQAGDEEDNLFRIVVQKLRPASQGQRKKACGGYVSARGRVLIGRERKRHEWSPAFVVGLFAVASALNPASVSAQTSAPSNLPAPSAGAPQVEESEPAHDVKGFRSALFGATEAEVRSAITKDFAVAAEAIHSSENLAERTQILTVRVTDVLPEGGAADVSYSLGYKSRKLIQVAVTWSRQTDDKLTPGRLLENGESLRNYFQAEGFVPDTVVANVATRDGVLLFRGSDAEKRTTVLLLRGATTGEKGASQFSPSALVLLYLADPRSPDVYRVPAGKF